MSGAAEQVVRAVPGLRVRVLVVDDDEVDRRLVARLLLRAGVDAEVVEAEDGAVAFAAMRAGRFDLVFLDYEMPGRDGLAVLRQLRVQEPLLPVVMLTGRDEIDLAVDLLRAGAADYLCKHTVSAQRISQSVRHALRVRHAEVAAQAAEEARLAAEEANRSLLAALRQCADLLGAVEREAAPSDELRSRLAAARESCGLLLGRAPRK